MWDGKVFYESLWSQNSGLGGSLCERLDKFVVWFKVRGSGRLFNIVALCKSKFQLTF